MSSSLTCPDHQSNVREGANTVATIAWSRQHTNRVWRSYTQKYTFKGEASAARCQRDEFPPAHFMRSGTPQELSRNSGQVIRWLPGSENEGAASLWRAFCPDNDGGAGNNQRNNDGSINRNLVSLGNVRRSTGTVINAGVTTTIITESYSVEFTRAVFSMAFDWGGRPASDHANTWRLEENPCWPRAIITEDPG